MNHVVLKKNGNPYRLLDEVKVINPDHPMYGKYGEICTIRNYDNSPNISVRFIDGDVYSCKPEEIHVI